MQTKMKHTIQSFMTIKQTQNLISILSK